MSEVSGANSRSGAIFFALITGLAATMTAAVGTAQSELTRPASGTEAQPVEFDGLLMVVLAGAAVAFQVRRAYRATWRRWHKIENDRDLSS